MAPAKKNTITKHPTMAQAVAAAQLQMTNALKDAKNPHFKSNFASLPVVRDIVIPAYAANGVAVIQAVIGMDGYAGVKTTLYWQGDPDKPREQMDAGDLMMTIGNVRNVAQAVGSIVSYNRRYMLAAAGGIGQIDDDGNSADKIPPDGGNRRQAPKAEPKPAQPIQNSQPARTAGFNIRTNCSAKCPACGAPVWDDRERAIEARKKSGKKTGPPYFKCSRKGACPGNKSDDYGWGEFNDPDWLDKQRVIDHVKEVVNHDRELLTEAGKKRAREMAIDAAALSHKYGGDDDAPKADQGSDDDLPF